MAAETLAVIIVGVNGIATVGHAFASVVVIDKGRIRERA